MVKLSLDLEASGFDYEYDFLAFGLVMLTRRSSEQNILLVAEQ